jgi:hypothetical protein
MFLTHPLYAPVMGLSPFVGLRWTDGPDTGKILEETGRTLVHRVADMGTLSIRADVLTDGRALFAVGYGWGNSFEDHCTEPMPVEGLQKEAVALHLHQLVAFLALGIDPAPFAAPLIATNPLALAAYVARSTQAPAGPMGNAEAAVARLLHHVERVACVG